MIWSPMTKRKMIAPALLALALIASGSVGSAEAQTRQPALDSGAREVWNKVEGQAAADVLRYAMAKTVDCWRDGRDQRCLLANLVNTVNLHHGTASDGSALALAVISFSPDTGNALWLDMPVLKRAADGRYRKIAEVNGTVGFPQQVVFEGNNIRIVTATMRENDSRCCPSGRTTWRVDAPTGKAVYASGYRSRDWGR